MNKSKMSPGGNEESPESVADYHRGADNSISEVMSGIELGQRERGVALSGVDGKDLHEIEDTGDGKKEPEAQRQKKSVKGKSTIPGR